MKAAANIPEVARAAGVSATIASHALNGKGRTVETRERVIRVATELAHEPHRGARNLREGKTGAIGLAVSQYAGISSALTDFAFFMSSWAARTRPPSSARVAVPVQDSTPFTRLKVDGAVVVGPVADDPLVRHLRQTGVPFVTTGRIPVGRHARRRSARAS